MVNNLMIYDPLFVMDTSAILCHLEKLVGYTLKNNQCADRKEDVDILKDVFSEQKISILPEVQTQIERKLCYNTPPMKRSEYLISSDDQLNVDKNLQNVLNNEDNFELRYPDKKQGKEIRSDWKNYYNNIIKELNKTSNIKVKELVLKHLKKKSEYADILDINDIPIEKIKKSLRKLRDNMYDGHDIHILAGSMILAENQIVFLISNDSDHIIFDTYFKAVSDVKMWIMRPYYLKQNISLVRELVYQSDEKQNIDSQKKLLRESNITCNDEIARVVKVLSILQKNRKGQNKIKGQNKLMIKRYMETFGWPKSDFINDMNIAEEHKFIIPIKNQDELNQVCFVVHKKYNIEP